MQKHPFNCRGFQAPGKLQDLSLNLNVNDCLANGTHQTLMSEFLEPKEGC